MKYLFCVIIALRSPHTCMRMRNAQCVHAHCTLYNGTVNGRTRILVANAVGRGADFTPIAAQRLIWIASGRGDMARVAPQHFHNPHPSSHDLVWFLPSSPHFTRRYFSWYFLINLSLELCSFSPLPPPSSSTEPQRFPFILQPASSCFTKKILYKRQCKLSSCSSK